MARLLLSGEESDGERQWKQVLCSPRDFVFAGRDTPRGVHCSRFVGQACGAGQTPEPQQTPHLNKGRESLTRPRPFIFSFLPTKPTPPLILTMLANARPDPESTSIPVQLS